MAVVFNTGEFVLCDEVDVFNRYVMADMCFYPIEDIFEIMEVEETT